MMVANDTARNSLVPAMDKDSFLQQLDQAGYCILRDVLPRSVLPQLKVDLQHAIEDEAKLGFNSAYAMVLMCSLRPGSMIDVLALDSLMQPFEWGLTPGCIIYAYTSSSMPPHGGNYSNRIHVDCPRIIPGYRTNMGATILLDDFTEENGATWFLPGSHTQEEAPSEEDFYKHGKRVIAPAGSVFYFNARLGHAGGRNETDQWRHALTINMCHPYMKQRIDIPRAMAHMDLSGVPEKALQKLGFLSQVPASYEEYYAPPHLRKFRQPYE